MKNDLGRLSEELFVMAKKHFVLLESQHVDKKLDTIQLNVSGYSDVMFMIADLVKVSILALGSVDYDGTSHIPEPCTNISGVLGIVLDLIPYEEADFLDLMRESVLGSTITYEKKDFIDENYFLVVPAEFAEA